MYDKPKTSEEWNQYSILNPQAFERFFKNDFISLAGFIAELLYRKRSNYKSSKADFRQWAYTSLNKLPERLSSKYQSFILEYTFQVLQEETNWSNITAIALALIDEETLTYDQVCEVIDQNLSNPSRIS